MSLYEHVFLARPDVSAAQVEALTEKFKSIVESGGGKVGRSEYWGLKNLSYRIKKNRKAHYTLMNIEAEPAALMEMERQMRLDDDVIRFLTVRVEEHEEGPSAMVRSRSGRDDRGRRDGGPRRGGPRRGEEPAKAKTEPKTEAGSKKTAGAGENDRGKGGEAGEASDEKEAAS